MKKLFLMLTILLCTQGFAKDNDRYAVATFRGLSDDNNIFLFARALRQNLPSPHGRPIARAVYQDLPCRLQDLRIIGAEADKCITDKKELKKFQKDHEKAVENIVKPGSNYYVKVGSRAGEIFYCDVSDDRRNFRLSLVNAGYAIPLNDDSEVLLKAAEEAKDAKRGMYSAKFYDITNCILNGVPMPKKDR